MRQSDTTTRPLISIIMNCCNSDRFLRETIESVSAQTYTHWEIIFWDNQSNDRSAKIAKSFYDPRIRYYLAPFRTDLGLARVNAVKKATGEWLAFLDADDLWLPDKLERQIKLIEDAGDSNLGLVYGRSIAFGSDLPQESEMHSSFYRKKLPEGNILKPLLFKGNFITFSSILVLREAYNAVGGIPGDFTYAEDYYLLTALAKHYTAAAAQEYVVKYRLHGDNNTRKAGKTELDETIRIVSLYIHDYPQLLLRLKWFKTTYYTKKFLSEYFPRFLNLLLRIRWSFQKLCAPL